MRKLLPTLTRGLVALAATGALVAAGAGTAAAQEIEPLAEPFSFNVTADGTTINYTATGVPYIFLLGHCATTLIDAVKAAPIVGPAVVQTMSDESVNYLELIADLREADAIVDAQVKSTPRDGVVTGAFTDVPVGAYAVGTICNANPDLVGIGGAIVIGDILPPGISTGSVEDAIGGGA
ncbi:hypothetical protein [Rhodococcus sp. HNM0569]|uniref:hypothetical protein n=1 Tax=Rhodococcus sp. HNM0569 TaxID=2716340 RepID=UPI00146A09BB|nr:hypothetical protein [Rhodococcus sp. HNM0569]NLU82529.1 hypothetical protein [Rhodococcus sp. HNM0569]